MIEKFKGARLDEIMAIWLDGNIGAHPFIPAQNWTSRFNEVRAALPSSELYFYPEGGEIKGFIGLVGACYIAGLFVASGSRSRGIGRALLDHCKKLYQSLELDVFTKNEGALRFYLNNGFVIESEKMNLDFAQAEYHLSWSV